MKPNWRWTRILILCLLVVSVFVPIFILFQRLKQFSSEDDLDEETGFVEGLPVLKHVTESQELTVEQDESEIVKDPTMIIYKDEGIKSTHFLSETEESKFDLYKQNATKHENEKKGLLDKDEKSSITRKKETIPLPTRDQARSQKVTNERVSKMKYQVVRAKAFSDCPALVKMLRAMTNNVEDQVRADKDQTTFLMELSGRTTPKGLHYLSMLLTTEYFKLRLENRTLPNQHILDDRDLFHFAQFSDNILASGVVVNSTVSAAMEHEKIVFHVVTDSIHQPAMSMWFLLNPPGKATVQVLSIDKFNSLT